MYLRDQDDMTLVRKEGDVDCGRAVNVMVGGCLMGIKFNYGRSGQWFVGIKYNKRRYGTILKLLLWCW